MMQLPRRNFLLLLLLLLLLCPLIESIDIKWTPGQNDPKNEEAQTAPKSQKYWDDHGIKRPDYAKTDAEIAHERGGGGSGKWLLLAPLLVAAGYFVHVRMGEQRLGGSHALFFRRVSEEEARQARLARFERGMESGKAE
jgi:hypothetical protein